jgi:hypothetical protein
MDLEKLRRSQTTMAPGWQKQRSKNRAKTKSVTRTKSAPERNPGIRNAPKIVRGGVQLTIVYTFIDEHSKIADIQ